MGRSCYDGGLQENNPIHIAVSEGKRVWGSSVPFDLVLSIGSGEASTSPDIPSVWRLVPAWVATLYDTFMTRMNGQERWKDYLQVTEKSVISRSRRLNVKFADKIEPELDAIEKIDNMQEEARHYKFPAPLAYYSNEPLIKPYPNDVLREVALRLRASLFFFELQSMSYSKDNHVTAIRGVIYCRLRTGTKALDLLLAKTKGFQIMGERGSYKQLESSDHQKPFKFEVELQQPSQKDSDPLRLEVKFLETEKERLEYTVAISGFPCTLSVRI
jgi:hypothetical protein